MDNAPSTVGDRIAQLPDLLGINIGDFARAVGVSHQMISSYKRTGAKPGYDVLMKIIEQYAVSPDWLLSGIGNWRNTESIVSDVSARYDREDFSLVSIVDRLRNLEQEVSALRKKE